MAVDPLSILIGVPILGPIVAWLLLEQRRLQAQLVGLVKEEADSKTRLALEIAHLGQILEVREESTRELIEEIQGLRRQSGGGP